MRKFSLKITNDLIIHYNHFLSDGFFKHADWSGIIYNYKTYTMFVNNKNKDDKAIFKKAYPLIIYSRKFDKPAIKNISNQNSWWVNNKLHRIGKPAMFLPNGRVIYYENGNVILINPGF